MEPPQFQSQNNQSRKRSKNSDSMPSSNSQPQQQFYQQQPPQQPTFQPQQQFYGGDQSASNFQPQQQMNQGPPGQSSGPGFMVPGGTDFVAGMAQNYAADYTKKGQEMVDKYIDAKSLKLYFQVDTNYVLKKLQLLFVPYVHKEWSVQNMGTNAQPRSPREDLNVPDLYIPFMALLTYVLLAGIKLGQEQHFSPDQLGANLSTGLGWIIFEVLIVSFVMYLISLRTDMKTYDVVSYLGYKFVPVCALMITCVFFSSSFYWPIFLFTSSSLAYFIAKTMSLKIRAKSSNITDDHYGSADHHAQAHSKTQYVTWAIAAVQPMLIWILTHNFS